jgi:energy-coupling factor transporter ATP-binding protein EcfA2
MKETLNLNENPFDPECNGLRCGPKPLGKKNGNGPDLICRQVAGFGKAESDLLRAVFRTRPETIAADAKIKRGAILVIVGPSGSGRTTLANLLHHRVFATGPDWNCFPLEFDPYLPSLNVKQRFASLRTSIGNLYGDGEGKAFVRIENLPADQFKFVMSAFIAFPNLLSVFVVTTSDEGLLTADLAAPMWIEVVELKKLPEDEVGTLLKDRIPKYRAADNEALKSESDLALFPFSLDAPKNTANKPIQMVRHWAGARIDNQHDELDSRPDLVDARQADAAELRTRLIVS